MFIVDEYFTGGPILVHESVYPDISRGGIDGRHDFGRDCSGTPVRGVLALYSTGPKTHPSLHAVVRL